MATADRLYELACECRDDEMKLDRLARDVGRLEATRRAAFELVDALEWVVLPEKAQKALQALKNIG